MGRRVSGGMKMRPKTADMRPLCFLPKDNMTPSEKKQSRRAHYDFVVLNTDFYKSHEHDFDVVANKDIGSNETTRQPYIDTAIEFKFFTRRIDIDELEFDFFKLQNADEVDKRLLVAFSRVDLSDADKRAIREMMHAYGKVRIEFIGKDGLKISLE